MKRGRSAPKSTRPTKRARPTVKPVRFPAVATDEIHYFDADKDLTTVPNIGGASWANAEMDPATVLSLFVPTTGSDITNRTGRKVFLRKIKVRGLINSAAQADQTGADGAAYIRVILYQDKQTNAAQAQAEDVMASGSATLNNVACYQNLNGFGRFKVWKDIVLKMEKPSMSYDGTNIEQGGLVEPFSFNLNFKKPIVVHFNSTNGGTIADIIDNSFHIIAASNNSVLVPQIAYKSRCVFSE